MDRTKLLTVRQVLCFVGEYCCNTELNPIQVLTLRLIAVSISTKARVRSGCCNSAARLLTIYGAEEYDAEVENMNTIMTAENQSLQHDNKQLNALIKEYEQTLETLMS